VTREEMAEACAAAMWAEDHASKALGMHLERVTPHSARLTVLVTERMVNGHGTCHGGFIFALADSAFAFACNTTNQRHVAAHCDITYLRPARMGDHLVADAHRRAEVGRSAIYDVSVATGEGVLIAEFRGHARSIGAKFFEDLP